MMDLVVIVSVEAEVEARLQLRPILDLLHRVRLFRVQRFSRRI